MCIVGGESKITNELVTVKMMKRIRQHRSMTSAMNRQPSRSYKEKKVVSMNNSSPFSIEPNRLFVLHVVFH